MASVPLAGPGSQVIQNNMREARRHGMSRGMATPGVYYWFYEKVRNHGPWDYKQFNPYFAAFGNFNFGAAGYAAGIPPEILLMGAGFAQSRAGTSKPIWGNWYEKPPYGDDPTDQRNIREGIEYAIQNGY
ncbi:polymorphic toxin type 44 domain-containing protein [Enterobacteriaceae bacterium H18W14]|uniref:polymorphic toxin type 44 domain-containing protein n=1 Tax=Dryocola boscaweniae TaxID=2925397 RepID=UPI0022F13A6F|nr:polymorphic toxin type 44 domain-containing protein [Dryocola boscaweniae]MCT4716308.1 polymorphic toxin type 44 domain-containing protein [Dryocola boscaweniae]